MTDAVAGAVYHEDARSYRSLVWSLLLVPVLFGADLLVSGRHGALVHLPGWLIAGALLIGAQWLLLHAVRNTHSLYVTPDELVVGDEAVPRADITGVTPGRATGPDLATLGWPNGFPRGAKAVTVRLADDRDVLVPTRFPDLVVDALQMGVPGPERPVVVRVAQEADLAEIPVIDERAEAIFRVSGYDLPAMTFDAPALAEARLVLVIDDPPAGFAWVEELDGQAHLHELSVLPGAMRRGYGSRLLEAACEWAAEQGYPSITLTTFVDVPWNAPFYATRGFVADDDPGPGLRAARERERAAGLDAVGARVVMRRALTAAPPT
ncbi:GNAT family N-acetyltransferase [uncultured Jatrophihabitans sp.]|uniref:GNAT family N-acetyltransferase n=1 Tax=uncultured Jatrophihabitans sp. TaxID=1610747 RepID=UPI0035CBD470